MLQTMVEEEIGFPKKSRATEEEVVVMTAAA